jgi:hypothetical protein
MSLAARVMGWQRRMGGVAGPLSASGESSNGNPVQVELFLNGSWTDITSYVMTRDGNEKVVITRGRSSEGASTDPASCQFQLNNRDGRFSPRNPVGPYYGVIGRNTPLRVSVPDGLGGKSYRFWGEVTSWPQRWDITGNDVWVELEAAGLLRRLQQGETPTTSVLYRAINDPAQPNLLAYWPMEDAADSTSIASALTNGSAMRINGNPTLRTTASSPPTRSR